MSEQIRARESDLEWRNVEGEVVILDLRTSNYLSLNKSGALLWHQLVDGTTRSSLIQLLMETYELSEETARQDVDEVLEQLRAADLLG